MSQASHHDPLRMTGLPGGLSRRGFLVGTTALTAAAGTSCAKSDDFAATDSSTNNRCDSDGAFLADSRVAFDGENQAGVATPAQAYMNLVAFNLRAGADRDSVRLLMQLWTDDARRLTQGINPVGSLEPEMTQVPANLTITCGFGSRLFDIIGLPRQRPAWLGPLPSFSKDKLDNAWAEADLVLQICCDDPLMLAFATRHMTRSGIDYVQTRWFQQGFLNAAGALDNGATPRNLFGQKDGTVNPSTAEEYLDYVWIDADSGSPAWATGGTAMVVRRVAMNLDTWEMLDRKSRENAMGRYLESGAPLTGTEEFEAADFEAVDDLGLPIIDPNSHMALAAPPLDVPDQRIKRRAYNYNDAPEPGSELVSNSGLIFVCFQQDPLKQFVPIQQRLNDGDHMNTWITHIGSAVFVLPPGTDETGRLRDEYWGASLLES